MNALRILSNWLRNSGPLGLVLLISGAVAWIIVALVVLAAVLYADPDASEPTDGVEVVGLQPTLAAATIEPTETPTSTPTTTSSPTPSRTPTRTASPAPADTLTPVVSATPAASVTTAAISSAPSATPDTSRASDAGAPASDGCAPPDGWDRYVVQPGDTLFAFVLGADAALTVDDLMAANCLTSRYLRVGQVLHLPTGAAENAPPSEPYVPPSSVRGPRTPNCPCTISVPDGWRREQVADAVNAAETRFTGADFLAATDPGVAAPFDFVMARPPGASMEGFLYPGTYTLTNESTADDLRDQMLSAFERNVEAQLRADAAAQGVSFHQALTIASIVQREVRGPNTQKIVASIYYNLLRDGSQLGTTVSVQYALGRPGAWWPRVRASDLEVNSPYNTYQNKGLPPGPICSPGLSAITAAIYPAQTEYRFHTAACDGSGEAFAVTFEEHLRNVNCE